MLKRICAWCKATMGYKEGGDGETHGICEPCKEATMLEEMYVMTDGNGYVLHADDGLHVMNRDQMGEFIEEMRGQAAPDDFKPECIYRLVPFEWKG